MSTGPDKHSSQLSVYKSQAQLRDEKHQQQSAVQRLQRHLPLRLTDSECWLLTTGVPTLVVMETVSS